MLTSHKKIAIVLAAGKGTRMKSETPKMLHEVNGTPLVAPIISKLSELEIETYVVVGHKKDLLTQKIQSMFKDKAPRFVEQKKRMGTGHAVKTALRAIDKKDFPDSIFVFNGDDSFLYTKNFIKKIMDSHEKSRKLVTLVVAPDKDQPISLGRLIWNKKNQLIGVWDRDKTTQPDTKISGVLIGGYGINAKWFKKLKLFKSAVSKEFPLPMNLIKHATAEKEYKINTVRLKSNKLWHSTNTKEELEKLKEKVKNSAT